MLELKCETAEALLMLAFPTLECAPKKPARRPILPAMRPMANASQTEPPPTLVARVLALGLEIQIVEPTQRPPAMTWSTMIFQVATAPWSHALRCRCAPLVLRVAF
jgi:hypothetical protein